MQTRMVSGLVLAALVVATAWAAEAKLDGVKCLVNPKASAKADKTVDYKGGKVFFCCANCPQAFAGNPAKFAVQANHQLVQTGQAKQEKCPLSGQPIDPAAKTKVGEVQVAFCCDNCKGEVAGAKPEDALAMVFSDKAFDKSFQVTK